VSSLNACVLSVNQVGVHIGGTPLLDGVSFQLEQGEILAVVGPNGAGKSTLIKAMSGEQPLFAGNVDFHGKPIADYPQAELAQRMAILPQKSVLSFPFTGREVVELARIPHDTGVKVDTAIVNDVLDYLDAGYLQNRFYPSMSGGEQQRIQLARVLAQIWKIEENSCSGDEGGRLLLLDEPSSYFDLAHQQLLVKMVRELAERSVSVVIVLHDLNLAASCADRLAVLCCGRLYRIGRADQVLDADCIRDVFNVEARFIEDPQTARQQIVL